MRYCVLLKQAASEQALIGDAVASEDVPPERGSFANPQNTTRPCNLLLSSSDPAFPLHLTIMTSVLELLTLQGDGDSPRTATHPGTLTSTPILLSPSALVHPNEPPISDKLYSGFIEHVGRCIYGGIVDNDKAPSPEGLLIKQDGGRAGWRKDVLDIVKKDGELEIPMIRWPGGQHYILESIWSGLNEREQATLCPTTIGRTGLARLTSDRSGSSWLGSRASRTGTLCRPRESPLIHPLRFGTDEFIDYCRAAKFEPYICLNSPSP